VNDYVLGTVSQVQLAENAKGVVGALEGRPLSRSTAKRNIRNAVPPHKKRITNLWTALAITSVHLPPVIAAPDDLIILVINAPILGRVNSIESVDGRPTTSISVLLDIEERTY
jgi:hypothetical protein